MDALEAWSEFNVAMAGATAALAGLVIVAASVNIAEIVKAGSITSRLAASIATLVLAIAASGLGLVPQISSLVYGSILGAVTIGAAVFQVHAARVVISNRDRRNRMRFLKASVGAIPLVVYLVAAVLLMIEQPSGLYVAAAGCLLAIAAALVISWVALVEVLR
ncbi:hypothetical protein [Microbacterium ulmi]|uniref:Modulator of FtsH protease n=1 Tax=Microbacterium ulmi TaxID=179095 RepID=A0A7Y2Q2S3_9MICO|nr:hypothetical protein [Microbacterium ulmi]NII68573.1 hypothetical protein [Microbacterium ulmi]NNH05305.1 hypothetical protein [Microbacterium ulmi]